MRLRGLLLAGALVGCSGQMQDQPVYKSQSDPVSLASGSIPVHPPRPWAVAIAPHAAPASNPIAVTPIVLQQGQQLFTDNCAFCHGDRGKGDGPVGEVFLPRPANLTSRRVRSLTDGDIYERITNGFSTMPTFRKHLEPSARWRIVAYVRELQRRSSEP